MYTQNASKTLSGFSAVSATALILAVCGGVFAAPIPANAASPAPLGVEHSIEAMVKVNDVRLDEMAAMPDVDWAKYKSAVIEVTADLERNRSAYNLTDREAERLVEGYVEDLERNLARRAGVHLDSQDSEAMQIRITIKDVDLALPDTAQFSARAYTFGRWSAAMEIEGVILAPDGSRVIAEFTDQLDNEEAFISRHTNASVFGDLGQLAGRSSMRLASAIGTLNGN